MATENNSVDERRRRQFEQAWQEGRSPAIRDFLPAPEAASYLPTLEELVCIDLEFGLKRNPVDADLPDKQSLQIEPYLDEFPELRLAAIVRRLAEEEFRLRRRAGDDPDWQRFADCIAAAEQTAQNAGPGATHLEPPPASKHDRTVAWSGEGHGSMIGPYKLLQQIGEGGMGVVYMAEQTAPVKRRVALKIIKPGMDSRQVIARFEAERQALAMMQHPNIAQVLDAGTTETGRPYFVMELVKGVPINQFADERRMTLEERLQLFVPVCHAVQHAHQKGIIHRDLKPSNVLVAEHDDRAVPKIIDFGVAKATQQRLTEKTLFTEFGQIVGTFAYMSPEQAKLNQLDIDTRSDVYSLGVLLYELLTGETPFDKRRLQSSAFEEILRIIREEEPPRPSHRLTSSQALPSIAAGRQIEPRKLSLIMRGELDWIVMKALEKERSRRYATATALAEDVDRFLKHEPVQACPPSTIYRLRKFARKNRVGLTIAAVASSLLILLSISSIFAAARFQRLASDNAELAEQRKNALNEVEAARKKAVAAERDALAARDKEAEQRVATQKNYNRARAAVDEFLNRVTEEELLTVPGMHPLRQELLASASKFYEEFAAEGSDDPYLLFEMARARMRLAQIREEMGDAQAAREQRQTTYTAFQRLLELTYGSYLQDLDSLPESAAYEKYGEQLPPAEVFATIGELNYQASNFDLSEKYCRAALALSPQHREARATLATVYYDRGRNLPRNDAQLARRLGYAQQCLKLRQDLANEFPQDPHTQSRLSHIYNSLGLILSDSEQRFEALQMFERAYDAANLAAELGPTDIAGAMDRVYAGYNLSFFELERADNANAFERVEYCLGLCRQICRNNPNIPSLKAKHAKFEIGAADLYARRGRADDARRCFDAARQILEHLPSKSPDEIYEMATIYANLASSSDATRLDESDADDREKYARLAVENLGKAFSAGFVNLALVRADKSFDALRERADFQFLVANAEVQAALAKTSAEATGLEPDPAERIARLRATLPQLAADSKSTNSVDVRIIHADALHSVGILELGRRSIDDAKEAFAEAAAIRNELLREHRNDSLVQARVLQSKIALVLADVAEGRTDNAVTTWDAALQRLRQLADAAPQDKRLEEIYLASLLSVSQEYGKLGMYEEAAAYARELLARQANRDPLWDGRMLAYLAVAQDEKTLAAATRLYDAAYGDISNPYFKPFVDSLNPRTVFGPTHLREILKHAKPTGTRLEWFTFTVAVMQIESGDLSGGIASLRPSQDVGDNATVFREFWLARAYHRLGDRKQSRDWFEKGERRYHRVGGQWHQNVFQDTFLVGLYTLAPRQHVFRRNAWREIYGIDPPGDPWRYTLAARGHAYLHQPEEALAAFEKAQEEWKLLAASDIKPTEDIVMGWNFIEALLAELMQKPALARRSYVRGMLGWDAELHKDADLVLLKQFAEKQFGTVTAEERFAYYSEEVDRQPKSSKLRFALAVSCTATGREEAAEEHQAAAMRLAVAENKLDDVQTIAQAAVANKNAFEKLVKEYPEDVQLWIARARYLARCGQWKEASAHYAPVIDKVLQGPAAAEYAATLLLDDRIGEYVSFCEHLRNTYQQTETPDDAFTLAVVESQMLGLTDVPTAALAATLAETLSQKSAYARRGTLLLAVANDHVGDWDHASAILNRLFAMPGDLTLDETVMRAILAARNGRKAEADLWNRASVEQLDALADVDGGQPVDLDAFLWMRALLWQKLAKLEFDAEHPPPHSPHLMARLGWALTRNGHPKRGLEQLAQAYNALYQNTDLHPDTDLIWFVLDARPDLTEAIADRAADPHAFRFQAGMYAVREGYWRRAGEAFRGWNYYPDLRRREWAALVFPIVNDNESCSRLAQDTLKAIASRMIKARIYDALSIVTAGPDGIDREQLETMLAEAEKHEGFNPQFIKLLRPNAQLRMKHFADVTEAVLEYDGSMAGRLPFLAAIAHQELGHAEEATRLFKLGVDELKNPVAGVKSGQMHWKLQHWLRAASLYHEAATMRGEDPLELFGKPNHGGTSLPFLDTGERESYPDVIAALTDPEANADVAHDAARLFVQAIAGQHGLSVGIRNTWTQWYARLAEVDPQSAALVCRRLVDAYPQEDRPERLRAMAGCLRLASQFEGQLDPWIDSLKKHIDTLEKPSVISIDYAALLVRGGRQAEVIKQFTPEEGREDAMHVRRKIMLALAHSKQGNQDEAQLWLDRAVAGRESVASNLSWLKELDLLTREVEEILAKSPAK